MRFSGDALVLLPFTQTTSIVWRFLTARDHRSRAGMMGNRECIARAPRPIQNENMWNRRLFFEASNRYVFKMVPIDTCQIYSIQKHSNLNRAVFWVLVDLPSSELHKFELSAESINLMRFPKWAVDVFSVAHNVQRIAKQTQRASYSVITRLDYLSLASLFTRITAAALAHLHSQRGLELGFIQ